MTIERDCGPVKIELSARVIDESSEHFDGYGTRPAYREIYIEETSIPLTAEEESAIIEKLRQKY